LPGKFENLLFIVLKNSIKEQMGALENMPETDTIDLNNSENLEHS
jgi:hypothetical protein